MKQEENYSSSDDDGNKLTIALTPEKYKPQEPERPRKARKRKVSISSEDDVENDEEAQIDKAIELKLQECAKRNNLTQIEMKKLLKKLVGNDHVLALVKLQEEEELANEKEAAREKHCFEENNGNSSHHCDNSTPKLTRSKARALNKKPFDFPSLNETEREPEVTALISEELHSDEEDDEYQPKEEDESEDDYTTTISDLDSQPRTPMTPVMISDIGSPVTITTPKYTSDGIFKVPRERTTSALTKEDEIIAKRTRSKLCLEKTAIETIESTFIPPDITLDMYDLDQEMDQEWVEFLNEFTKPLNPTTVPEEDDTVADPEYVAADKIHLDAEELKDANISKKELNDLVAELFDGLIREGVVIEDIPDLETPKKFLEQRTRTKSPQKTKKKSSDQKFLLESQPVYCQESFQKDQEMQNPLRQANLLSDKNVNINQDISSISFMQNEVSFTPNVVSTPHVFTQNQRNNSLQPVTFNNLLTPVVVSSSISSSTTTENNLNTVTRKSKFPNSAVKIIPNGNTTLFAYPVQGAETTCYQISHINSDNLSIPNSSNIQLKLNTQNLRPVAYIDLTKSSPASQNNSNFKVRKRSNYITLPDIYELWNGDAHSSAVKYYKEFYNKKYKILETAKPEIQNTNTANHNIESLGFTSQQKEILDQQMRIHVQMLTQNYLQTYSNPQFWRKAVQKNMLLELKEKSAGNSNSAFNAWNLDQAIDLVNEWEKELSENSEENTAFMEYLYNQSEKCKRPKNINYNRIIRFPPKTMKKILKSKVFMYPEYLPRLPFRWDSSNNEYHEFAPIESHLIAFGIEKLLPKIIEIMEEQTYTKGRSLVKVACENLSETLIPGKNPRRIYDYYKKQLESPNYNPIKYYDKHKCAPPFKHNIIPIDLNSVLPPENRKNDLPMLWSEFLSVLQHEKPKFPSYFYKYPKKLPITNEVDWLAKVDIAKEPENQEILTNPIKNKNITINYNYIFDKSALENQNESINTEISGNNRLPKIERRLSTTDYTKVFTRIHDPLTNSSNCDLTYLECSKNDYITPNYPILLKESSCIESDQYLDASPTIEPTKKRQKLVTDFFSPELKLNKTTESSSKTNYFLNSKELKTVKKNLRKQRPILKQKKVKNKPRFRFGKTTYVGKKSLKLAKKAREQKKIQKKLGNLQVRYWYHLHKLYFRYSNKYLNKYYIYFKSLELYTNLLINLKMNCKKSKCESDAETSIMQPCNKKSKMDDETAKLKKANRVGESLRHMLLPDSREDIIKKDSIYAYNFYEKVEETFVSSGKENNFKKFLNILKSFDPEKDTAAELFYKMEKLFLPDHPDLAEIFLTFLLPTEAVKVGKFFEHFIVTNMGTFMNKLNIYFNKQPAQIRKIYNCLNELSEDSEITMDKIKNRILPLLKGNQFLIEWFLQIFPDERPPERLLTNSESLNLKEVDPHQKVAICETVPTKELLEDSTDAQSCQIKYIHGRLFYGSRILLPAKLAFMAKSLSKEEEIDDHTEEEQFENNCVHGIRELGEKCLRANQAESNSSCDENDKSEDKEAQPIYDVCNESTLRIHAARLNPSLYSSEGFYKTNHFEEGKSSPKKQFNRNILPSTSNTLTNKEKRKSPKKNFPRSPISNNTNVVTKKVPPNHDVSNVLLTAKKLKAICEEDNNETLLDEQNKSKKKKSQKAKPENAVNIFKQQPQQFLEEQENVKNLTEDECNSVEISCTNNLEADEMIIDSWTRDEDKIILEEVKLGFESQEELMERLTTKLKGRIASQIIDRYQFLMDVLCRLQNRS